MTLSTAGRIFTKATLLAAAVATGLTVTSCDSWIYDDEGDCSVRYRLSFNYTSNPTLLVSGVGTDAFGSEVDRVNLAVYDKQGKMVFYKSTTRELTSANDYFCDIDVKPGRYDILAWCEGKSTTSSAVSFGLHGQELGDAITRSGAGLTLVKNGDQYTFTSDINRLYHGLLTDVEVPDTYGTVDLPAVPLIKDTNHILVQLQNMDGQPLDPAVISFELEGNNSQLDWQNLPTGGTSFFYKPWSTTSTLTPVIRDGESRGTLADSEIPSGIQVEFTTSRLLADVEQMLTIRHVPTGEVILKVPVVEYLLLVRSQYQAHLTPQQYLDACDDYSMVFFIDENYSWMKTRIFINGWRVVPKQEEHL